MTNKSNTITIKFFASIREKINNDSVTLSMLPGTSIQDIIFRISEEFGIEKLVLKSCLYALNGEYVEAIEPGTGRESREFIKRYNEVENFNVYGNERFI